MKSFIVSLAVLLFYATPFTAFGADKKPAKRETASEKLPEACLKVIQNTAAAAGGPAMGNLPADFTVHSVSVNVVGEPPAPGEGDDRPMSYKGIVKIASSQVATVSVRLIRGGCIVTNYNE